MLSREELELILACVDCAIKNSDNSRLAASKLEPICSKLEEGCDCGNSDD
jgi:hypothetical protein